MGRFALLYGVRLAVCSGLSMPLATPADWRAVTLGGPRVVSGPSGGYTMFYHYRAVEDAEDVELPPISTGRIGRATSRDGLEWTVQHDGIGVGGDGRPCTLSANEEDWYFFDSGHVGCGDVLYGGDATFLYTYGGSRSPMALRDLGVDADGDVFGMDLKIGVCVSQDGVNFGRIEGDEADGSLISPDPDSWERQASPVGWPSICRKNAETGEVMLHYGTTDKASGKTAVGVATSMNGVLFSRAKTDAPCLAPGPDGAWDSGGILRRSVLDGDGGFTMFYEAKDDAGVHAIGRATSQDGLVWDKTPGPVFSPSESESWDDGSVGSPHVIRVDGALRMYYAASSKGQTAASFGVASSTDDGLSWTRGA